MRARVCAWMAAPYARRYARHVGARFDGAQLRLRLGGLPWWAAAFCALSALALAPCALLPEAAFERALARLQTLRCTPLKAMFFAVRAVVLPACYGHAGHLAALGYRVEKEPA